MADTVGDATRTPDQAQPWTELGLKEVEYARIKEILGRRPTSSELAMYSVMWSEHCSYKSSKVHLRRFAELPPETPVGKLLAGIGENAGVVDIGQGYAVTFKIESHNHPSYVEPYQGAATGVGGIVRDILAMGARPIGVMDSLRFGPLAEPDTARVLPGVVAGIGGYGNCLGLPNIGGELAFDHTYLGNPLVNALCVGVLRHEDLHLAKATGAGNKVILYGASTGADGIGGVSVLASESFDDAAGTSAKQAELSPELVEAHPSTSSGGSSPTSSGRKPASKRPSVQVGDPFLEKLLIECTLEIFAAGLITGIQDLGGAGLSCATSELASAGDGGMHIDLDLVPLRNTTLSPEEILMSESQERMMAIVEPEHVEDFLTICRKWDVLATVIGEVTAGDRLVIDWHGETVVDVPPRTVAHEGPVYERPYERPEWQDQVQANGIDQLPRPAGGEELADTLLRLIGSPNLCDKSWVTDQYDRYVRGSSVLAQPDDAGMLRIDEESGLGVALATDCNGRYALLDPYAGAQLALAEAYRNVATSGAEPLAITDCLNFGSPEDPAIMWQFSEAVRGLADGCRVLGTPVTGGNVSFYNQTGSTPILPTPVVGVLGVIDDVTRRTPGGFKAAEHAIYLLGETRDELAGSAWAQAIHDHLGGQPPEVDFAREKALAEVLIRASRRGLLASAHDLADGGLAQALAESALRYGFGARIDLPSEADPFVWLFSETTGRALVSVKEGADRDLASLCRINGVTLTKLGVVTAEEDASLEVVGQFTLPLTRIREAWQDTIRAVMTVH